MGIQIDYHTKETIGGMVGIGVLLGTGAILSQVVSGVVSAPINSSYKVHLADVNGDSIPDVMFKRRDGVYVLFGQSDGSLLSKKQLEKRYTDSLTSILDEFERR